MIAGVDFVPLGELLEGVPVATNGGGYAELMAEHALAMALAAAKRLTLEHENLKRGRFNQFTRNRMLAGGLCGIFGFGGIGAATARLMHGIGMRVRAINRHGRTDERVDWIGTPERLNELLEAADVLLISAPLTRATYGVIGAAELRRMKDDAILVNVARGEIVQERPLYDHLVRHPRFTACIDAWWIEPVRHGEFRIDQPFLDLPNVIASPHNSAQGAGAYGVQVASSIRKEAVGRRLPRLVAITARRRGSTRTCRKLRELRPHPAEAARHLPGRQAGRRASGDWSAPDVGRRPQ